MQNARNAGMQVYSFDLPIQQQQNAKRCAFDKSNPMPSPPSRGGHTGGVQPMMISPRNLHHDQMSSAMRSNFQQQQLQAMPNGVDPGNSFFQPSMSSSLQHFYHVQPSNRGGIQPMISPRNAHHNQMSSSRLSYFQPSLSASLPQFHHPTPSPGKHGGKQPMISPREVHHETKTPPVQSNFDLELHRQLGGKQPIMSPRDGYGMDMRGAGRTLQQQDATRRSSNLQEQYELQRQLGGKQPIMSPRDGYGMDMRGAGRTLQQQDATRRSSNLQEQYHDPMSSSTRSSFDQIKEQMLRTTRSSFDQASPQQVHQPIPSPRDAYLLPKNSIRRGLETDHTPHEEAGAAAAAAGLGAGSLFKRPTPAELLCGSMPLPSNANFLPYAPVDSRRLEQHIAQLEAEEAMLLVELQRTKDKGEELGILETMSAATTVHSSPPSECPSAALSDSKRSQVYGADLKHADQNLADFKLSLLTLNRVNKESSMQHALPIKPKSDAQRHNAHGMAGISLFNVPKFSDKFSENSFRTVQDERGLAGSSSQSLANNASERERLVCESSSYPATIVYEPAIPASAKSFARRGVQDLGLDQLNRTDDDTVEREKRKALVSSRPIEIATLLAAQRPSTHVAVHVPKLELGKLKASQLDTVKGDGWVSMSERGTSWTREAGFPSQYGALIEGESEPAPVGPEGKRREGKERLSPDLDLLRRFDYTVRKQDFNQEPDESKFLPTNFKLPGLGEMLFNKLGKWENKMSYQGNSSFGVHTPNRLSVLSQSNTSTLSPMTPRDRSKVRWEGSNILQAHLRRALKQREYNKQRAYRRETPKLQSCIRRTLLSSAKWRVSLMRAENLMTQRWEIQNTRNILSLQTNPAWAALKKETEEQFSRVFNEALLQEEFCRTFPPPSILFSGYEFKFRVRAAVVINAYVKRITVLGTQHKKYRRARNQIEPKIVSPSSSNPHAPFPCSSLSSSSHSTYIFDIPFWSDNCFQDNIGSVKTVDKEISSPPPTVGPISKVSQNDLTHSKHPESPMSNDDKQIDLRHILGREYIEALTSGWPECGGKVTMKTSDRSGSTALHLAAWRGDRLVCHWLVSNGADASALNHAGRSVLDFARESGSYHCMDVIMAAICKRAVPPVAPTLKLYEGGGDAVAFERVVGERVPGGGRGERKVNYQGKWYSESEVNALEIVC